MWFGVLLLTKRKRLPANRRADSMQEDLDIPHISEEYRSMGLICASKSWNKTLVLRLPRDHIVFMRWKTFLCPFLCIHHRQTLQIALLLAYTQGICNYLQYIFLYCRKTIFSPEAIWPPFRKTITFVYSKFTVSPKEIEDFSRLLIWFCKPVCVDDTRTIPSAKSKRNNYAKPGSNWILFTISSYKISMQLLKSKERK